MRGEDYISIIIEHCWILITYFINAKGYENDII